MPEILFIPPLLSQSIYIALALYTLSFGANALIAQIKIISALMQIEVYLLSATIIALATSFPELATSLIAASSNHYDLAIANIAGSNICNTFLLGGLLFVLSPKTSFEAFFTNPRHHHSITKDLIFSFIVSFILLALLSLNFLNTLTAAVIIVFFTCYQLRSCSAAPDMKSIESLTGSNVSSRYLASNKGRTKHLLKSLIKCAIYSALLFLSGKILVDSAVQLTKLLGFSERWIGGSIVALGTSAPEIATTLSALSLMRKDPSTSSGKEIILGNLTGSNLFNILWILPIATLSSIFFCYFPPELSPQVLLDYFCALCASVWLITLFYYSRYLFRSGHKHAFFYTQLSGSTGFVLYLIYVCSSALYDV